MSRGRRIQFAQLLGIILAWQIVALFITGYDYSLTHADEFQPVSGKYSLALNIIFNAGGAFSGRFLRAAEGFCEEAFNHNRVLVIAERTHEERRGACDPARHKSMQQVTRSHLRLPNLNLVFA